MPKEKTDSADEGTEDLDLQDGDQAGDESSTDDEELEGYLQALHAGDPLDHDTEVDEGDESSGDEEEEPSGDVEEGGEEELSPSEQHSLKLVTEKDQRIKELEAAATQREGLLERLSGRIDSIEESRQEPEPKRVSLADARAARVAAVVERLDGVDWVTGDPKENITKLVGELMVEQEQNVAGQLDRSEDLSMLRDARRLTGLMRSSPSLSRFVSNPTTAKALQAAKADPARMRREYGDPELNSQKAVLFDLITQSADAAVETAAISRKARKAGRKETDGAFSVKKTSRPQTPRKAGRKTFKERADGMTDEQWGKMIAEESAKASAREAEVATA